MIDLEKIILEETKYIGSDIKNSISASQVTTEPLQQYLKWKYGNIEDDKVGQNTLGSILHLGMEQILKEKSALTEYSMEYKLWNDWTITGTADLIVDGAIYDYKFTKEYSRKMWLKDKENHQYTIQLNTLRYLWKQLPSDIKTEPKMYIVWFIKDAKQGEPTMIIDEVPLIKHIEDILIDATNELRQWVENDIEPPVCKDKWTRKIKGNTVHTKCMYYCSYNKVCPHYNPDSYNNKRASINNLI